MNNTTDFKITSKIMQNKILDNVLEVCRQGIKEKINETKFLAIQYDEATGISNQSQVVVIQ